MRTITFLITGVLVIMAFSLNAQDEWQLQKDTERIDVYFKHSEKYIYDIRVKADFPVHHTIVVKQIKDIESYPSWVFRCTESKWLDKSDKNQIIYTITDIPWPFTDRDVVTKIEGPYQDKKSIRIESRALPDYIPESEKHVRQQYSSVKWHIQPGMENSTQITYTLRLRIEKEVPDFIVAMITTKGPYESFKSLMDMLSH